MFQFKQFIIHQDQCAMKVCTDSCLFGTLIDFNPTDTMLDIGTGTGLLSLMMAQRGVSSIDAIELDDKAAVQAQQNISLSIFDQNIKLYHQSIQSFAEQTKNTYTLIVSNPPFFTHSLKSSNEQKNKAHHTTTLSTDDLMLSIKKLLHTDGLAWLLLSPYECAAFEKAAMQQQLFFTSRYLIYDRADKPIRSIVCVSHKKISFKVEEITIYNPDRTYTEAFIQRLQPFYLYL